MLHAARYYEYFEEAFLHWLDASGSSYAELREQGVDLVIVESRCTHHRPVSLDETVTISVVPVDIGRRSLTVEFVVAVGATHVATGGTTYVAVVDGTSARLPQRLASLAAVPPIHPLTRRAAERVLAQLHDAQRAFYAGKGSSRELELVLDPAVVWRVPGASPIAGTHVGVRDVIRYMDKRRALAGNTFTMHRQELLVGDRHLAALTDGAVVRRGRTETWSTVGLYRVLGGRIAECQLVPLDQARFDEIWQD
jgi:YbgC/YbaW family acyl-CoA thioester hydrolase